MSKVTADNFGEALSDILSEYADNISENIEEVTRRIAQKGALAIRNTANATFKECRRLQKGRYGSGWTYKVDKSRLLVEGVIYNSKYPGLPHLLEYGHATVNGGRTRAFEHIYPVEKSIKDQFTAGVIKVIKEGDV